MTSKNEKNDKKNKGPKTVIPKQLLDDALAAVETRSHKNANSIQSQDLNEASEAPAKATPAETEQPQTTSSEMADLKDRYLRLAAEFENYKKRIQKEKADVLKYGAQSALKDLLEIVDNLERALKTIETTQDFASLRSGIEIIYRQLQKLLEKHGVRVIDPKHQEFDPAYHEALSKVAFPGVPADHIVEVQQKGYMLYDKLLRAARVVVSAGEAPSESPPESPSGEKKDPES